MSKSAAPSFEVVFKGSIPPKKQLATEPIAGKEAGLGDDAEPPVGTYAKAECEPAAEVTFVDVAQAPREACLSESSAPSLGAEQKPRKGKKARKKIATEPLFVKEAGLDEVVEPPAVADAVAEIKPAAEVVSASGAQAPFKTHQIATDAIVVKDFGA